MVQCKQFKQPPHEPLSCTGGSPAEAAGDRGSTHLTQVPACTPYSHLDAALASMHSGILASMSLIAFTSPGRPLPLSDPSPAPAASMLGLASVPLPKDNNKLPEQTQDKSLTLTPRSPACSLVSSPACPSSPSPPPAGHSRYLTPLQPPLHPCWASPAWRCCWWLSERHRPLAGPSPTGAARPAA